MDLKIVILGSASVGKTSVINRYCNDQFSEDTLSTIGAGFFTNSIVIDGQEYTLMLWDTAGEERFRSVAPSLLRGANGLVLVYDTQAPDSFKDLEIYMELFLENVDVSHCKTLPVLLLGNKCDLGPNTIPDYSLDQWKQKYQISLSYEVSAKLGTGINDAFIELVKIAAAPKGDDVTSNALVISVNPQKKSTCPC